MQEVEPRDLLLHINVSLSGCQYNLSHSFCFIKNFVDLILCSSNLVCRERKSITVVAIKQQNGLHSSLKIHWFLLAAKTSLLQRQRRRNNLFQKVALLLCMRVIREPWIFAPRLSCFSSRTVQRMRNNPADRVPKKSGKQAFHNIISLAPTFPRWAFAYVIAMK